MIIGDRNFGGYTYVMAIINLTPDSFFEGSRVSRDGALFAAERAVKEGAAVLDIGAQSTRPGYIAISPEEELSRLEKPLCAILENFSVPVSVDTYFPEVAQAALDAGAHMINDIHGLRCGNMAKIIADRGASVCIMHNRKSPVQGNVFSSVIPELEASVKNAVDVGICRDKICIDGGLGFAKSREQNLELLDGYERLSILGYPLLLGASRKSFFGGEVADRLAPTLESTRLAAKKGVLFVRVHDIKENVQAIKEIYECDRN